MKTRKALVELDLIGDPDDGMQSASSQIVDGYGKEEVFTIDTNRIRSSARLAAAEKVVEATREMVPSSRSDAESNFGDQCVCFKQSEDARCAHHAPTVAALKEYDEAKE